MEGRHAVYQKRMRILVCVCTCVSLWCVAIASELPAAMDGERTSGNAMDCPYQRQILEVANGGSWMKLWDTAHEHGVNETRTSLSIIN